jgi:phage gp36-like protein
MYITADDLARAMGKTELIQTTNDDGRGTEPVAEVVEAAIRYACDLVDGYLRGRYPLPLVSVPTILPPLCITIARHFLHCRRINRAEFPKPLETSYKATIDMLERIRDGKLHIGVDGLAKAAQPEPGAYHVRSGKKQDWSGY